MRDTKADQERISEDSAPGFNDELFKEKCRQLGATSQDAQAELFGITQPSISRIRAGRQIPCVIVGNRITKTLGVKVEELWPVAA